MFFLSVHFLGLFLHFVRSVLNHILLFPLRMIQSFHILPPPCLFPSLPPSPSSSNRTTPRPILTFRDTTPLLSSGTTQGVLTLDEGMVKVLGVERGFWICLALCWLEMMEEREGWEAARDG
jgi:hypothetical protein